MGHKWRQANPDKVKKNSKAYHERNRQKIKEYSDNYRHKNRDRERLRTRRWNNANKERRSESARNYLKNHRDKVRANVNRRRARIKNAEGSYTADDARRQYDSQKGKCWWCGKPVKWEEREDDHLIPLKKGGTNWPNNIVISCQHCNRSKGAKMPYEFTDRLF